MTDRQHDAIATWERRWLAASGMMSLLFIIFIAYSLAIEGAHIAQSSGRTSPEKLLQAGSFSNPAVRELSNGKFQVTGVAQTFSFSPSEIRLPVGAEVQFFLTSKDILHGYQIQHTNVNVELMPGEVSYLSYTFDKAGEYRITCNEYCGLSHQNMIGKIVVMPQADYAKERDERLAAVAAGTVNIGEETYKANCVACHQENGEGLAGAFPPLKDHAPLLQQSQRDYLIHVLLYGLQGPIKVNGANYNGIMPAWSQLSDEQVAEVLNYVLNAWGNSPAGEAYRPEEVAALRAKNLKPIDIQNMRQVLELE